MRIRRKPILPPLEAVNEIERDRIEVLLKLRKLVQGFVPVLDGASTHMCTLLTVAAIEASRRAQTAALAGQIDAQKSLAEKWPVDDPLVLRIDENDLFGILAPLGAALDLEAEHADAMADTGVAELVEKGLTIVAEWRKVQEAYGKLLSVRRSWPVISLTRQSGRTPRALLVLAVPIALVAIVTAAVVGRTSWSVMARQATLAAATVLVAIAEARFLESSHAIGIEGAIVAAVAGVVASVVFAGWALRRWARTGLLARSISRRSEPT